MGRLRHNVLKPLRSMQYKVLKTNFSPDIHMRYAPDVHSISLLSLDDTCFHLYVILFINHMRETKIRFVFLYVINRLCILLSEANIMSSLFFLWNSLPSNIENKNVYVFFKYAVKKSLLS